MQMVSEWNPGCFALGSLALSSTLTKELHVDFQVVDFPGILLTPHLKLNLLTLVD